jgi:hypothetical protein
VLGRGRNRGRSYGVAGSLTINLSESRRRLGYRLQAESLLQFCALELLQTRIGGIDLVSCETCGDLLPIHKHGRPKRYCSDACKMAAYRDRKQ